MAENRRSSNLSHLSEILQPHDHGVMKLWRLSLLLVVFAFPCWASSVDITTTSLPDGVVHTTYLAVIQASGGDTPYKWTFPSGALPDGVKAKISRNTTWLTLTGTPTAAATYSFAVKVSGRGGKAAEVSYKVVVQATAKHVVELSWNASTSDNIDGYNVYRGPDRTTWIRVNPSLVGSTVYSDSSVADRTTYYYATTAVDIYGRESHKSAPIEVTIR
jgi:putative Ig domain-containing protein